MAKFLKEGKFTERGFSFIEFKDRYGSQCSLQASSLASEPAIWFGVDKIEPQIQGPTLQWEPFTIPEDVLINSRMHLTQKMVRKLLPLLTKFAETGDLNG